MPASPLPLALFTALLALTPLVPAAAQAQPAELPRRIQVQAEVELAVVPDRATLRARLWEHTPSVARDTPSSGDPAALREARERLEARVAALVRTLEAAGVARRAITAGSLQVQPESLPGNGHGGDEREARLRTRVERSVDLEIATLERLPIVLDALTAAGVDALDGITYDLADREAATDTALVKALEKARHKASLMADTLGVTLGEVLDVSEVRAPVFQPRRMAMSADAMERGAGVEYRPGTISVDAGVSVSWEIAPSAVRR